MSLRSQSRVSSRAQSRDLLFLLDSLLPISTFCLVVSSSLPAPPAQPCRMGLVALTQRSRARSDTFIRSARAILTLPIMPKPEAFSRLLLDQALKHSGWDLLDERRMRLGGAEAGP